MSISPGLRSVAVLPLVLLSGLARAEPPPTAGFPGQWSAAPTSWKYPVWAHGCLRFPAPADRLACDEFVLADWPRLSRFAEANQLLAAPQPGERRVVFFGDSITDNWSKPSYGGFFPGRAYVNRGIGGQTTGQMLIRFRPDVIALKPRAVVILAGTNDIAGNNGPVSTEAITDNITALCELGKAAGIRVILASLLPVSDDKRGPEGKLLLRTSDRPSATLTKVNLFLRDYAQKNHLIYLDYYQALVDERGQFKTALNDDGLHPNAAGYAVMGPLAEKAIAAALGPARKTVR